jgi:hypothetical protein
MVRHRRLFLALALGALLSLTGREANAGNLTITVSWTGGSISVDFTDPQAVPGGTANSFAIDPTLLNTAIAASGYQFSELGGSSNNPGDPSGAILRVTGTALLNGTVAPPSALTVTASQTEFTSPSGTGTLDSQSSANFRNATAGSGETSTVSLDATSTPSLAFAPPGAFLTNSTGASGSAAGYTLSAEVIITLVGASGTSGASDQFTNNVTFTAVIPEPASLVMMVTGMPLPLVVMGLLRRRRAAAA